METYTEITQQEDARRQRAYFYERAIAERTGATNAVEGAGQEIERYRKTLASIKKTLGDVEKLDPSIEINFGVDFNRFQGSARDAMQAILLAAQADQQRRLDAANESLERARTRLEEADEALKAFQS